MWAENHLGHSGPEIVCLLDARYLLSEGPPDHAQRHVIHSSRNLSDETLLEVLSARVASDPIPENSVSSLYTASLVQMRCVS